VLWALAATCSMLRCLDSVKLSDSVPLVRWPQLLDYKAGLTVSLVLSP
jgi:hypothetical protein